MSVVHTDTFRGPEYEISANEERQVFISIQIPAEDECHTIRKGALFNVDVFLRVQVDCSYLAYVFFTPGRWRWH